MTTAAESVPASDTPVAWSRVVPGALTLLLSLPAIFGTLGTGIPALLYPGGSMPAETAFERAVISIYAWSVLLGMMSPPATLMALLLGAWTVKRVGWRSSYGRAVLAVLVVAVLLSIGFFVSTYLVMQRVQESGGWPRK